MSEPSTVAEPGQELPAFVSHLTGFYATQVLALGRETGLLAAALTGPVTAAELAATAGVHEPSAALWAGAATVSGYLTCDKGTFTSTAALEMLYGGQFPYDVDAILDFVTGYSRAADLVSWGITHGCGVNPLSYSDFLGDSVTRINTPLYRACLVEDWLASVDGLTERLTEGIDVADIACGAGDAARLVAEAFPASRVIGLDLDEPLITRGRTAHADIANLQLQVAGVDTLPDGQAFDLIYVLDALHHFPYPYEAVAAMAERLRPGGWLVIVEGSLAGDPEVDAASPFATIEYGAHLLYCTQEQIGQGSEGTASFLDPPRVLDLLQRAGLTGATSYPCPSGMAVTSARRR